MARGGDSVNGVWGFLFWALFFGLFIGCAIATRRHDRRQELDAYERMNGAPW